MKSILLSIIAFLFTNAAFAQDNMVLRSGEEVKAKVEEVGLAEIKYKRTDNPTGPVYTIRKADVLLINYQNGTKDVFNNAPQTMVPGKGNCPYTNATATVADYNKYRKLGIKRIVGGAIMTAVGVPTLLTGVGLSISGLAGSQTFNYNSGMWEQRPNYQKMAAGGFFTVAGAVLTVLGPISIKKGMYYRKLAKDMKPTTIGFTPIHNPMLDRYNNNMGKNKVGFTLTF